ncbi:phosphoribosylanthranilate isomerase [Rubidibacter lacunae]|uniref:phosphoribosylanthranilate isomerase n=1 Tax=Rubidibacter lacunae TaxID=582514 RepID=UPI000429A3D9|nr:phosphoribosylanthranilate isomerase [Rubidibacter lacunae]
MRVKICGITQPEQGRAIADLGASDLGFICVPSSPRYVTVSQLAAIGTQLPAGVRRVGVFANSTADQISTTVRAAGLTAVQLHGRESPADCQHVRACLPDIELIKALRVRSPQTLEQAQTYAGAADTLLLDAYHPQQLGGTGQTLDWETLAQFRSPLSWLLAGGLNPDNIADALRALCPDGIDLSSGVEIEPGIKDLKRVELLFARLQAVSAERPPSVPCRGAIVKEQMISRRALPT